jgi:hypothetical protein
MVWGRKRLWGGEAGILVSLFKTIFLTSGKWSKTGDYFPDVRKIGCEHFVELNKMVLRLILTDSRYFQLS